MVNNITLFTNGTLATKDGREFTRLMGGFGDNKPMFTIWQAAELLGIRTGDLRENFTRNISNFEELIDVIDLKSANVQNESHATTEITTFFKSIGYSQSKLNATEFWLIFSLSGMMKLVKISSSRESWSIYNNFLEDYFKTKAENIVMKKTLQEELEFLEEQKGNILGKMFMCKDETRKMELFTEAEKLSERIQLIVVAISNENLVKQLQPQLNIAERLTSTDSCYDMNAFSKAIAIKGLGRNNMFEWLRNKGILRYNNEPFQQYLHYFKVIYTPNPNNNKMNIKTLVRPNGVPYIFKKLVEDGKMISKSVDEILSELEPEVILN